MEYETLASVDIVEKTIAALKERNVEAVLLNTKEEALEKIKTMIPAGASVMNGASTTLQQIGFVDYLKAGEHGWNNLHKGILDETDPAKQGLLRKQSVLSDFYLGSVHALAETGEMVIGSNSGSQLPHIAFTSPNVIFVVSTQKIVPTLADTFKRLENHVIPLEDARMKSVGYGGTMLTKTLIFNRENPAIGRHVHVLFVNETLGF